MDRLEKNNVMLIALQAFLKGNNKNGEAIRLQDKGREFIFSNDGHGDRMLVNFDKDMSWGVKTYTDMVHEMLEVLNFKDVDVTELLRIARKLDK